MYLSSCLVTVLEMFAISITNYFSPYLIFTSSVLFALVVSYVWFVCMPYASIPGCRFEPMIPYVIWKKVSFINYVAFHTLIEKSKRYQSEGVFVAWIGTPSVIVYGEEVLKAIVWEHAANDKPPFYKLFDFYFNKSIGTSNGEAFKKQLKMAAPAFHVSALKSYVDIMNKHSEEMVEMLSELDGRPTDDILNILAMFALRTIFESNLGDKEINTVECLNIMETLKKVSDFMNSRVVCPWLYPDISLKLFPSAREAMRSATNMLERSVRPRLEKIKESIVSRQASGNWSGSYHEGRGFKPFGEIFVEQHLLDPTITMDEITHQVALLWTAGFDTVTHTLEFALCLLGLHQDVQERAFQEVMSETEGQVTYEDQQRLTYLECVVKETLRLYPTVPVSGRKLTKDLQVGKYKIPRNSTIAVFFYMLHRNPEIYPDPEKFYPERFMDKNSRIKPWNFIPFSEGIRPCLGKNYAMVEMKILLAHLLRHFRVVSLDCIEEKDMSWSCVLLSTKKLRMRFLPRT